MTQYNFLMHVEGMIMQKSLSAYSGVWKVGFQIALRGLFEDAFWDNISLPKHPHLYSILITTPYLLRISLHLNHPHEEAHSDTIDAQILL